MWLNRSQVLGSMPRRVFAVWNNCSLGTYRLFLQPGNHRRVPGPSTSHIQGLTLQSIWNRAQEPPTPSWGRSSHAGWKDMLWSCLADPGLASLCMEEAPAATATHTETQICHQPLLCKRHVNKGQLYQNLRLVNYLSFLHASLISSAFFLLASNAFGCNKAYGAKLSKWS